MKYLLILSLAVLSVHAGYEPEKLSGYGQDGAYSGKQDVGYGYDNQKEQEQDGYGSIKAGIGYGSVKANIGYGKQIQQENSYGGYGQANQETGDGSYGQVKHEIGYGQSAKQENGYSGYGQGKQENGYGSGQAQQESSYGSAKIETGNGYGPVKREIGQEGYASIKVEASFKKPAYGQLQSKCKPGEIFYDKCNLCKCNLLGSDAICTKKACPTWSSEYEQPRYGAKTVQKVCKPGEIFYDQCNVCKCVPDGSNAVCSKQECQKWEEPHSEYQQTTVAPAYGPKQICTPGAVYKEKCNLCRCNTYGTEVSCTQNSCEVQVHPTYAPIPSTTVKQVCPPGKLFYDGCNICKCTDSGTAAVCRKQECPEKPQYEVTTTPAPAKVCNPGYSFYNDCNLCKCAPDGSKIYCTNNICEHPTKPYYQPTKPYYHPTTEHYYPTTEKKVCQPLKIFKYECNLCFCDIHGLSAKCTNKKCLTSIDEEKVGKIGIGGEIELGKEKVCTPGKIYKDDCSLCTCSLLGTKLICIKKKCESTVKTEISGHWDGKISAGGYKGKK